MLDYQGGPGPHIAAAKTAIATIGLSNFPAGSHRDRMTELLTSDAPFHAVTDGTEAVYALLADADVSLTATRRATMVEALAHLSRAALAWRVAGKDARWGELQTLAWAVHNGDTPPAAPEVDAAMMPAPEPDPTPPPVEPVT
jgi:hypothetical protein